MADLGKKFKEYAKFGNPKSEGKTITLKNIDKWLKEAGVIDGKKVTTTDTGILFQKLKSREINLAQFKEFIASLVKEKNLNANDITEKLSKAAPSTSGAAKADKSAVVDRMTDTSKYTGSHKERFDKSGKGKGLEGREESSKNDGYVQGYKHKDTYDKNK